VFFDSRVYLVEILNFKCTFIPVYVYFIRWSKVGHAGRCCTVPHFLTAPLQHTHTMVMMRYSLVSLLLLLPPPGGTTQQSRHLHGGLRLVSAQGDNGDDSSAAARRVQMYNLGFLEMELKSTSRSETYSLLKNLLDVTVLFLDASFQKRASLDVDSTNLRNNATKGTTTRASTSSAAFRYQRISCSIHSYQMGDSSKRNDLYAVNATITGQAYFWVSTTFTDERDSAVFTTSNVSEWTHLAFDEETESSSDSVSTETNSFVQALLTSRDPFLSNITYATVLVDGAIVAAETMDDNSKKNGQGVFAVLEVWMIPLIGGGGAFLLVLCCIVTCICCIKVDDKDIAKTMDQNERDNANGGGPLAVVPTIPTTTINPTDEDEEDRGTLPSLPPSPVKSIGSQDSSTFTYNPRSVRSFDNRTANSYAYSKNGVEMDLAAWQAGSVAAHHGTGTTGPAPPSSAMPFGHDISAIEEQPSKRDLSLIQEEDESACSPLDLSVTSRRSGKYKSLLSRCSGGGGGGNAATPSILFDTAHSNTGDYRKNSHGCALSFKPQRTVSIDSNRPTISRLEDRDDEEEEDAHHSDTDNSSFFGPSQDHSAAAANTNGSTADRLNLSGSAADVLNDLYDLSSEIDQVRGSLGSGGNNNHASSSSSHHHHNRHQQQRAAKSHYQRR
jgi:hypothetical protein